MALSKGDKEKVILICNEVYSEINWKTSKFPTKDDDGRVVDIDSVRIYYGRKQTALDKFDFASDLQKKHTGDKQFISDHINVIIQHLLTKKLKEEGDGDGEGETEWIGSSDVLDGFFSYIRIDDSTNIYIIDEFPMKNYHFNDRYARLYDQVKEGAPIQMSDIPSIIKTYMSHLATEKKKIPYEVDISRAMDEYLTTKADAELDLLMKDLVYEEPAVDYVLEFVKAVIGDESQWVGYCKILRHWMWCVKRRALNRSTIYQLMIVFTGAQGTGKTYSINHLVNTFNTHVLKDAKFSQISEERSAAIDSTKLIWVLDELPFAKKMDMDKLKSWVTAEETIYRPMGTNSSVTVQKKSMAIGSNNESLGKIIQDNTGNRRFVDFPLKQKMNEYIDIFNTDHQYYEEFQPDGEAWLSMWKSIDEDLDRGYIDFEEQDISISKIFNSNYTSTVEHSFYEEVFTGSKTIRVRRSFVYEMYMKFAQSNGHKPKGNNKFVSDLENMVSALGLKYSTDKYRNSIYCDVPAINEDYKEMFCSISSTVAGIFKNGHFFADNELYSVAVEDMGSVIESEVIVEDEEIYIPSASDYNNKTIKSKTVQTMRQKVSTAIQF